MFWGPLNCAVKSPFGLLQNGSIGFHCIIRTAVQDRGRLLISCRNKRLNQYEFSRHPRLGQIYLATNSWRRSKSVGDSFTIHALAENNNDIWFPFESLPTLDSGIITGLKELSVQQLTRIQLDTFPAILADKNVMIAAQTGCGKTLAYLIPLMQRLIGLKSGELNAPMAVVVVPSRELAVQIGEVASILGEHVGLKVSTYIGGKLKKTMLNPSFDDMDVLVATPAAIGKLSTVGIIRLRHVRYMILDEADSLLDDSFAERMTVIMKRLSNCKYGIVSATIPKYLPPLLSSTENDFEQIISTQIHRPLQNVTQKFIRTNRTSRMSHLLEVVKNIRVPTLIFGNTNRTSTWLSYFIREHGVPCGMCHKGLNVFDRTKQWNSFVTGEVNILAVSDVASRGLDTRQVSHVINYDFPMFAADYLHRIGRVGRIGSLKPGRVTNFISCREDVTLAQEIETAIRRHQELPNVDGNTARLYEQRKQLLASASV